MRVAYLKHESNGVRIDRRTVLGNPARIGVDGDRSEVIQKHEAYLLKALESQDPVILSAMLALKPDDTLLCHCHPLPCHGDTLVKYYGLLEQYLPQAEGLIYTGIGARPKGPKKPNGALPSDIDLMERVSQRLDALGFTVRSGRADGSDWAFEKHASRTEIFLPWKGFGKEFKLDDTHYGVSNEALLLANTVYPTDLLKCSRTTQLLMARNCYQILGLDLRSPVQFVVCWTEDGCEMESQRTRATGGTGQAIALANRFRIPVYNLRNPKSMEKLAAHVKRLTAKNRPTL